MLESWYTPKENRAKKLLVKCDDEETKIEVRVEAVCDLCDGSGLSPIYVRDESGNFVWDGDEPCVCKLRVECEE